MAHLCAALGGHITRLVAINRTESTTEGRNTTQYSWEETGSRLVHEADPPTPGPARVPIFVQPSGRHRLSDHTQERSPLMEVGNQELD